VVGAVMGAWRMRRSRASRIGVISCRASPTALAGEPSREVRARIWVFQRWRRTVTSSRSDSDRGPRRRMGCRARLWCRLIGGWSRSYCSTAASRSAKAWVSMPVRVGWCSQSGARSAGWVRSW
jgi:hypothetical protein